MALDSSLQWLIAPMFALPLLVASYFDITQYRIPNRVCLAMALLFPAAQWISPYPVDVLPHAMTALALLGVGFMLFIPGLFGGGDAKLLAVCGLWLGPTLTPMALMLTALTGGLLSLLLLVLRAVTPPGDVAVLRKGAPVPYGLAIAAAGLLLANDLPQLQP